VPRRLGPFRPPTSTNGLRASRSICERGQGGRHDFGRPALKPATHGEPSGIIVGGPNLPRRRVSGQTDSDCSMRLRQWYRLWYCRGNQEFHRRRARPACSFAPPAPSVRAKTVIPLGFHIPPKSISFEYWVRGSNHVGCRRDASCWAKSAFLPAFSCRKRPHA
jgi:hypothetical protein